MHTSSDFLLEAREHSVSALRRAHPPRLSHPHKQHVYRLVEDRLGDGTVGYSRWKARPLPSLVPAAATQVVVRPDVYDYRNPGPSVWHVNFADPRLFVAYGSALLAQDELQVLEHPVLGLLREALVAEGLPAVTEEGGAPTPVLVTGARRVCALDTSPGVERLLGLYGNRFAAAPFEEVRAALTLLEPAPVTNLVAMAAPVGRGRYRPEQLEAIVRTAYSGFAAAADVSGRPVEVRTGFWGCGAFGGNRVVMAALQLLAARLASVERLVFHTVTSSGVDDYEEGASALAAVLARGAQTVSAVLERFAARGDEWGKSNGT